MADSAEQQTWAVQAPVKTLIGMLLVGLLVVGLMPTAKAGAGSHIQSEEVTQMQDRAD